MVYERQLHVEGCLLAYRTYCIIVVNKLIHPTLYWNARPTLYVFVSLFNILKSPDWHCCNAFASHRWDPGFDKLRRRVECSCVHQLEQKGSPPGTPISSHTKSTHTRIAVPTSMSNIRCITWFQSLYHKYGLNFLLMTPNYGLDHYLVLVGSRKGY